MAMNTKDSTFNRFFLALVGLFAMALLIVTAQGSEAATNLEAIELNPQTFLPHRQGDDITFTYKWENTGDDDEADVDVTLYVDTGSGYSAVDTDTDIDMDSGMSGFGNLTWTDSDANGTIDIKVKVDSNDEVAGETSEADNEFVYDSYEVEPDKGISNLWINRISMEPNNPGVDQTATITFTYGNDGNLTPSEPISVGLFVYSQGENRPAEPYATLPPMIMVRNLENPQWEFDWTPEEGDDYTLELVIDYDNNVSKDSGFTEEDTADDTVSWDLPVTGEDAPGSDLLFVTDNPNPFSGDPAVGTIGEHVLFRYTIMNQGGNHSDIEWSVALFVRKEGDAWPAQPTNLTNPILSPVPKGKAEPHLSGRDVELGWDIPVEIGPGNYDVMVIIDYYENLTKANGKEKENDRNNNAMTWLDINKEYFEVQQKFPDLKVDSIIPGDVFEGDQTSVLIIIANRGDIMAQDVKVDLWLRPYDTSIPDTQELDGVNIGAVDLEPVSTFYVWNWTPEADGTYQIEVIVDPDNDIQELPEGEKVSDNTKKVDVEVIEKTPDLEVKEVRYSPNDGVAAIVGTPTEVTVEVANIGLRNMTPDELGDLQVKFKLGDTLEIRDVAENIEPGATINLTFTHTFIRSNYWNLEVTLDPLNRIIEAAEDNNAFSKAIWAKNVIDTWIEDLRLDSTPQTNTEMNFIFTIHLDNAPSANDRYVDWIVEVFDNATGITAFYLESNTTLSAADHTKNVTVPWTPTLQGKYRVVVELDFNADTDDTNNELMAYFDVAKYEINLEIAETGGISVDSNNVGTRTVSVEVRYNGTAPNVANVKVWVKVFRANWLGWDDEINLVRDLGNQTVDGDITQNDYRTLTYSWANANKGCYIIVAQVDPDDSVNEVDEDDNLFPSKAVSIAGACEDTIDDDDDDDDDSPGFTIVFSIAAIVAAVIAVTQRRRH